MSGVNILESYTDNQNKNYTGGCNYKKKDSTKFITLPVHSLEGNKKLEMLEG